VKHRVGAVALIAVAIVLMFPHRASAGLLDNLNNLFQGHTEGWLGNALNVADATFGVIYTLFFFFVICKAAAKTMVGDVHFGTVLWPLGEMLFFLAVPWIVLHIGAREVLPNLVGDALQLSGMITGEAPPAGPDAIFAVFLGKGTELLSATTVPLVNALHANGGVIGIFTAPQVIQAGYEAGVGALVFLIVLACGALVAVEVLAAYIEVYVAISIGAVSLGFMASAGTAPMARPYIAAVYSAMIRLVVIFAFVTLATALVEGWAITAAAATPATFMSAAGQLFAAALAILYMTFRLSRMADKISGSGGAAMGGVEGVAAGFAAGSSIARLGTGAAAAVRKSA
jgi:hypothetical protein